MSSPASAGVGLPSAPAKGAEVKRPPLPKALLAQRQFTIQLGVALQTFGSGDVVTEARQIEALLRAQAPVEKIWDLDDVLQCPHCRRAFTIKGAIAAEQTA